MDKKFKIILFLVLGKWTVFCFPRVGLKPVVSAFSQRFIDIVGHKPSLIKKVYLFSQVPLEKQLENQLLKLKCERGLDINIAVTQLIATQEKKSLQELKKDNVSVFCLPESYDYLDWQKIYNDDEIFIDVKFVENYEYDSLIQAALVFYSTNDRVVLFGKDQETVSLHECLPIKKKLDRLHNNFINMFEQGNNR
jgi:hypothetical protein